MINFRKVSKVLYQIQKVFEPDYLGWSYESSEFWLKVRADWRTHYSEENRQLLAQTMLHDFNLYFAGGPEPKDFGTDYKEDLSIFKLDFLRVLEEYSFKNFERNRFFSFNRKLVITERMNDQYLAAIFRDLHFADKKRKVSKEDLVLMLETYCYCFEYIVERFNKPEVHIEKLVALGLPVEAPALRELVLNCESLGELFQWGLTDFPFSYWAEDFLDHPAYFKNKVYGYLNRLHPELQLKIDNMKKGEIKIQKTNTITGDWVLAEPVAAAAVRYNNLVINNF
jgi:hypothetical protein